MTDKQDAAKQLAELSDDSEAEYRVVEAKPSRKARPTRKEDS